ncbi:MAG: hypothetical protein RLZZ306_1120 [Bacteroidota bacterium]|jgi:uncharacterized membrane protein
MYQGKEKKQLEQHPNKGVTATQTTTIYQGILPDPESMKQYEEIMPGFTEKMVNMTIDESVHRREIEKSVVNHSKNLAVWGMGFAFSSVLVISSLCFYAFYNNFPIQAATIATGVIVALAGVFLLRKPNKEKAEK